MEKQKQTLYMNKRIEKDIHLKLFLHVNNFKSILKVYPFRGENVYDFFDHIWIYRRIDKVPVT